MYSIKHTKETGMNKTATNLPDIGIGIGLTGTVVSLLSLITGWTWGNGVFSPAAHGATGLTFLAVLVVFTVLKFKQAMPGPRSEMKEKSNERL